MWSDCRQTVGRSRGLRWFAFTLQPAWRSGREAQSGSCRPPPSRVRRPLLAAASACLRAITARHFKGSILRRARNCRFSSALNVASYARRPRASYRQATRAKGIHNRNGQGNHSRYVSLVGQRSGTSHGENGSRAYRAATMRRSKRLAAASA
jgi:hypothetical protein